MSKQETDFHKPEPWPLDRLKPYDRNPRVIPKAAVDKVVRSLIEFGWAGQYPVADADGITIIGHARHLAAQRIHTEGLQIPNWPDTSTLPVIQRTDLSEEKVKALRIMDNRAHEGAVWDEGLLAIELQEIGDVEMTGFSLPEVSDLLASILGDQGPNDGGDGGGPDANSGPAEAGEGKGAGTAKAKGKFNTQATIGEYRFEIERGVYDEWLEEIRQSVGFDKPSIVTEIKRRLGLV